MKFGLILDSALTERDSVQDFAEFLHDVGLSS